MLLLFLMPPALWAADPPPPVPSKTSTIGQTVTNPVDGTTTTVSELVTDPAGTPTPGAIAYVRTSDGFSFAVKDVGEKIYIQNIDTSVEPSVLRTVIYTIVSKNPASRQMELDRDPAGGDLIEVSYAVDTTIIPAGKAGTVPTYTGDTTGLPASLPKVAYGRTGDSGHDGALIVGPGDGDNGFVPGDNVYINTQNISVSNKTAILVGSVGGNGGAGGDAYLSPWGGGSGGFGANGGVVDVTNSTGITARTDGNKSHGIYAFSIAGKGGDGGGAYGAPSGGSGGGSRSGGDVTVTNNGHIVTEGDGSFGIYALSRSSSGGSGGDQWGLIGASGNGATGGNGAAVNVTNSSTGTILTSGESAHGILAQSVGGVGGDAGTSGNLVVSLGGGGDSGGTGGTVTVTNNGDITTTGKFSRGIYAQSLGGGGGSGGDAGGLFAFGGGGAGGGSSKEVTVTNGVEAAIRTEEIGSDGIFAQSIGGSGGDGGDSGGLVTIGGDGDIAGNGNKVTIKNYGTITTEEDFARGLVAQSIGGGGGDGGSTAGMIATIGGSGAGGGYGDTVTVTNGGTIRTQGDEAKGILAQSIGGGGGNGGSAVSVSAFIGVAVGGSGGPGGAGGNVEIKLESANVASASVINTQGDRSTGLHAQSVGGGGGNGGGAVQVSGGFGGAVSIAIGGDGGVGGDGGNVTLSKGPGTSIVETDGDDATAVFIESVGGGGGNGGYSTSVAAAAGPAGGSISVSVGGKGDAGGDGGVVRAGRFNGGTIVEVIDDPSEPSQTHSEFALSGDLQDVSLAATGFNGSILTKGERSTGFMAQSVGGGGGNGGVAVSVAASAGAGAAGSLALGLGGDGAGGGDGGVVIAGLQGNITTEGSNSTGLLAQSVGGGGGNGGGTVAASAAFSGGPSGAISVGVGGDGGLAGHGGDVLLATRSGQVTTQGDNSTGIVVQSVGGGGGNGGYSVSASLAAGTVGGAVSVGLGGEGGEGGNGGDVWADIQSDVTTSSAEITELMDENGDMVDAPAHYGQNSGGVVVQSVGGGGGNGGMNVSAAVGGGSTAGGAIGVGLGGGAGAGGEGGNVYTRSSGTINTKGDNSVGFLAQSVGGGGGNGGFNVSAGLAGGGTASGAVNVGLGGKGGSGNISKTVTAIINGQVKTQGNSSSGVVAQSIGGGGGNGGFNVSAGGAAAGTASGAVSIGLGGEAGEGGNSGKVYLTVTDSVVTEGNNSPAVIAQSVGGGGGNGGFNVSAALAGGGKGSGAISVGLGGNGGAGGDGNEVRSTVTGNLTTQGEQSTGLLVQSVGGGGGNGGFNVSAALAGSVKGSGSAGVGIGGSGEKGGHGGEVWSEFTGDVITSHVLIPESVDTDGKIIPVHYAENSGGIVVQSLGGGGGNGGINVTGAVALTKDVAGSIGVGIGGTGGGGGSAKDVHNTVTGYVQTQGDKSIGILAQSLGGGGGNGGINVSGAVTGAKNSGSLAVGVGGFGGDGGEGAVVTSTVTGGVLTTGHNSDGIVAQSLGGGGGNGGTNVTGSLNLSKENGGSLGVGIGGFGGKGGNAKEVTSTVAVADVDDIFATAGDDSSAVVAQSIGGGGGNGGVNVTGAVNLTGKSGAAIGVGVGGFGGGAGDAAKVILDTTGDIVTLGNNSNGLMAQSLGGGGGNGGTNVTGSLAITKDKTSSTVVSASIGVGGFGGGGGKAGDVDVDYNGTIVALPRTEVSPGVFAINETEGSHGLVAQSLGGGGGNGAVNVSAGISYAAKEADGHALLVGVGGFGGEGGNAGIVDVDVTGNNSISSYGNGRSGILASSIGGGGGNGGLNVSGGISSDSPLIVGVGGMGGNAGAGRDVTVNAATNLFAHSQVTDLKNSAGLMAQSIGGGGGDGGLNVSGGIALSKENTVPSVTFGIGGFGGDGAISGTVDATHDGIITTSGGWTHGLLAQSIAGGGGNGALNVSGQINFADSENSGGKTDLSIVAGLGGHGGLGADAGNVFVKSTGMISTTGNYARGIFAQSIGGGGGTGGMNVSGVFAKNSSPIVLGVGGFGSGGGHAGLVEVKRGSMGNATGKITTDGIGAIGIEASSIGGGGGDAGMNFNIAVSKADNKASTGAGGSAGGSSRPHPEHTGVKDSVFTNYDSVLDELEGRAPEDDQDANDTNKESAFAAQIAIGGAGGEAGNGGEARVYNYGDIETEKDHSQGILAQSIGGGGGNATLNAAFTRQQGTKKTMGFNLSVGGQPGHAGNGVIVDVKHEGDIETHGNVSTGILAQSIGGGGGNVGMDYTKFSAKSEGGKIGVSIGRKGGTGGSAGDVFLTSKGIITTHGDTSYGLLAQSVGNGGGNSSSTSISLGIPEEGETPARATSVSVGLEGGTGGFAGNVELTAEGWVITEGENSHAIFAQSVGGGGGNAGSASGSASTVSLAIGGEGGEGGTGGEVTVISSAEVRTSDTGSIGILAQSIGGGGGNGGVAKTKDKSSKGQDSAFINIGGSGGEGMSGGMVTVDNSGVIITDGKDSHGVLAQSIGGGGGNAGMASSNIKKAPGDQETPTRVQMTVGGDGGEGGFASDVKVTNTGGIGTSKENSVGILAQSIGGGGGNAKNVSIGSVTGKGGGNNFSMGIGGTGGEGAEAGDVKVYNRRQDSAPDSGKIITLGSYSHGIMAMSIGGGGGTGSTTITKNKGGTADSATAGVFSMSLGGDGGEGGTGGYVEVLNDGMIATYGYGAHGILAQSVGGGGGNAGMSVTGDLTIGSTPSSDSKAGSISIGGGGGDGNTSGDVDVKNTGSIELFGSKSYGIYAQSVGGGGGDGGFATTLSRNLLTNPRTDLAASLMNIGVGGNGGDGADGGNVLVEHSGSIISHGDDSFGVFAQSVGGGGGNVGSSITSPAWMAADYTVSTLLGGRDGSKGDAGTVTVRTSGNITMLGAGSQAQFVQSINGGGGNADVFLDVSQQAVKLGDGGFELPDNSGTVENVKTFIKKHIEMGTTKITDAAGSAVKAAHVGDLYTYGKESTGSLLQSIGGGGGNSKDEIIIDSNASVDLVLALGGRDSANNPGGDIDSARQGDIVTNGSQSRAVGVQSIGGGGGSLTVNIRKIPVVTAPAVQSFRAFAPAGLARSAGAAATATLGSVAGADNDGGTVNANYSGNVSTFGDFSHGLSLQSIGGGGGETVVTGLDSLALSLGGSGGSSGDGGSINVFNKGTIVTRGELSHGAFVQSIGGGGGSFLTDLAKRKIGITLNKDNSGNGGDIRFNQVGDIVTTGNRSAGIFLQSAAGGGGSVDRMFAGSAGGLGNSGDIDLTMTGNLSTFGNDSMGIFAQSASGQGDSGRVTVTSNGSITTSGQRSPAIMAQSISGSGASGGVHVAHSGTILTSGIHSDGINASSLGGKGYVKVTTSGSIVTLGNSSDGIHAVSTAGSRNRRSIDIVSNGDILAYGSDSDGIHAEDSGKGARGNIAVTINGGHVQGGSGTGAGVHIVGGNNNTLVNRGRIDSAAGINGMSILADTGNEQVENYGTVVGNVNLGSGHNNFYNHRGANFISGSLAALGEGGLLTNAGNLSPGGANRVQTTRLIGNFQQTGSGTFFADLDFNGNRSDRVSSSGWAKVDGKVQLNTMHPASIKPGAHRSTIVSGAAGVAIGGVKLVVAPSAIVDYRLSRVGSTSLAVAFDVDFSPASLPYDNLHAIGDFFNDMQLAGGASAMAPYVVDIFNHPDVGGLAKTYDYMNPDFYDHFMRSSLAVSRQFTQLSLDHLRNQRLMGGSSNPLAQQSLFSGRDTLLAYNGSNADVYQLLGAEEPSRKKVNVWFNLFGQRGEQSSGDGFDGYDFDAYGFVFGADYPLSSNFLGGVSIGYTTTDVSVDNYTGYGEVETPYASVYGSYFTDRMYVDGVLSYGSQNYDTSRFTRVLSENRIATSEHDGDLLSAHSEAGVNMETGAWLTQPFVGLNYINLREDGHNETGADGLSLRIQDRSTNYLASDLGVHLSRVFEMKSENNLALDLTASWNHDFGIDDAVLNAGFAGYPAGAFSIKGRENEPNGFILKGGIKFFNLSGVSASVQYQNEWRDGQINSGVVGMIRYAF